MHCQLYLSETSHLGRSSITRPGHLKSLAIIVFNVTYKTAYRKEEMEKRTGMRVEGRGCEESGKEVGLKGERIRGGIGVREMVRGRGSLEAEGIGRGNGV